jgi:AbrB family looped-hinge helix DNA binding protein
VILSLHLVNRYCIGMAIAEFKVSGRGQMALPAEARRRWNLDKGGTVEIADLGDSLLIVPAGRGGLRALLRAAIEDAGGYTKLAQATADDEPDLA